MTVLVLDNAELLAQTMMSATMAPPAAATGTEAGNDERKPHRTRFHFGFNKHRLNDEDQTILRQHARWLAQNPGAQVRIHGHADAFGVSEYNQFLSRLRASSAAKLMLREGARESQIQMQGWGSDRPLARPEDHAANRRLEIEYLTVEMAQAL